ncbi:MAG: hypothetical protein LQ338_005803 [Usnochroma carphineum]|nr:MAG: hypothetical protein LQ338_005803 [Usnochroma carphineum]
MAGTKLKQPTAGPSNESAVNQPDNDSFNVNPQKIVTVTPFSVDMYSIPVYPNDDPTRPPIMHTAMHIRPEAVWAALTRYRNITLRGQTYSVHQYAIVSRFQPLPKHFHPLDHDLGVYTVARILEIRALDPQNVYVRLFWLYRPQEVPGALGGSKTYHGERELMVSDHMEIVDALRVVAPVRVVQWREQDKLQVPKDGMYYRQMYSCVSHNVSRLPTHCVCKQPINPERFAIQCTNPGCLILLHEHCICAYALSKLQLKYSSSQLATKIRVAAPAMQAQQQIMYSATAIRDEHYAVETINSQRPQHQGRRRYRITDLWEGRSWEQDLQCLKCGTRIG